MVNHRSSHVNRRRLVALRNPSIDFQRRRKSRKRRPLWLGARSGTDADAAEVMGGGVIEIFTWPLLQVTPHQELQKIDFSASPHLLGGEKSYLRFARQIIHLSPRAPVS